MTRRVFPLPKDTFTVASIKEVFKRSRKLNVIFLVQLGEAVKESNSL